MEEHINICIWFLQKLICPPKIVPVWKLVMI
jgi:hypothetical protein